MIAKRLGQNRTKRLIATAESINRFGQRRHVCIGGTDLVDPDFSPQRDEDPARVGGVEGEVVRRAVPQP